jgi:hypothetical protein
MIQALDEALDGLEAVELRTAVEELLIDKERPSIETVVKVITGHRLWAEAEVWLVSEPALSPVVLDRLKRYTQVKVAPNVEHPNDVGTLAMLLLLHGIYGVESPEFRFAKNIAKKLSNPWWSWHWILSLKAQLAGFTPPPSA